MSPPPSTLKCFPPWCLFLVAILTTASESIAFILQLRLSSRLLRQSRLRPTSVGQIQIANLQIQPFEFLAATRQGRPNVALRRDSSLRRCFRQSLHMFRSCACLLHPSPGREKLPTSSFSLHPYSAPLSTLHPPHSVQLHSPHSNAFRLGVCSWSPFSRPVQKALPICCSSG